MMPDLSLAHLTVISLAPPQMVDVAARTGYRYVGLSRLRSQGSARSHCFVQTVRLDNFGSRWTC